MFDNNKIKKETGIIGSSILMEEILEMIIQISPIDISVLITGESGTGKELIAKAIHRYSNRYSKSLVTVNCGAIPEGIIESELFGHKKGSFTGASEEKIGYFEEANGGTIFLDEIGEMPLGTQVKLLRVLESGEFMKVGDSKTKKVDVRVVAATNKNLLEESNNGNFRRDLYFRLRTVNINVPSLRSRFDDMEELIDRFALLFSKSNDIIFRGFTKDSISLMKQYEWPGNIRELKNFVESIIILEKGNKISAEIITKHLKNIIVDNENVSLPIPVDKSSSQAEREIILQQLFLLRQEVNTLKESILNNNNKKEVPILTDNNNLNQINDVNNIKKLLNENIIGELGIIDIEKELITKTLEKFNNNRRKTAKVLGLSERTLYRKINQYNIEKNKEND
tara:strand:- start:8759 stop:9943 length:1185 start_codon:yes stop_codon:yes gene_type:complete